MPKIDTYDKDSNITDNDKWVGTDSVDGSTKNFQADKVKDYVKDGLSISDVANLSTQLSNKVDKDGSKVLSDNNYTTIEKGKVATIDNKVDKDGSKVLSANDFTDTLLNKLNGLTGADIVVTDYNGSIVTLDAALALIYTKI